MTPTDALIKRAKGNAVKAFGEICDLAANGGRERWRMSIPVRDSDSDCILQAPLDDLALLCDALEESMKALDIIIEHNRVRGFPTGFEWTPLVMRIQQAKERIEGMVNAVQK